MNKVTKPEEATQDAQFVDAQDDPPVDAPAAPTHRHSVKSSHFLRCQDTADMAFQLIGHLASRGVTVSQEIYNDIHEITQIGERDVTPEIEHRFWSAYASIVDLLEDDEDPEGIYYTAMFEHPRDDNMSVTTAFHQRWLTIYSRGIAVIALSVLFLLVVTLAWGTAINNIMNSIIALDKEYTSIQSFKFESTRLQGVIDPACFNRDASVTTLDCMGAQESLDDTKTQIRNAQKSSGYLLYDFVYLGLRKTPETLNHFRQFSIAQQIFIFLSDYIYPLLAGALGACVSLLRQIFAQLREKRLHLRVFKSAYLRIAVGTIAGIVIGWISSVDSPTGISLTPLAIAFAAGYAVEIIYNVLDRFVLAFSPQTDREISKRKVNPVITPD
jgi:hypothetical protein